MNIIAWITANYSTIFQVIGYIVTCATAINATCPSQKVGSVLHHVTQLLDWVSVVAPKPAAPTDAAK
jgi:hypothetical protein